MALSDPQAEAERRPVSFPEWQQALAAAPLPAAWRTAFVREILAFLHVCKSGHAPVSIALARGYLAAETRRDPAVAREALRWFVLQEGLKRQVGEIPFQRAEAGRKIPTVLTREELARMFTHLTGTTRLMAELAYGAGLRLLELLRLRVLHLDLPRQQLQVFDGKGAKHRITVLPAKLVSALEEHIERLKPGLGVAWSAGSGVTENSRKKKRQKGETGDSGPREY